MSIGGRGDVAAASSDERSVTVDVNFPLGRVRIQGRVRVQGRVMSQGRVRIQVKVGLWISVGLG